MTSYFLNLKKANAETSRLSEELKRVSGELASAQAALAEHNSNAEAITAKADAAISDLTGKLTAAESRIKELEASAKTAGQIAAEVAAAQGIPADKLPKDGEKSAPNASEIAGRIRTETNPAKRAELYAQLNSVWNSKN